MAVISLCSLQTELMIPDTLDDHAVLEPLVARRKKKKLFLQVVPVVSKPQGHWVKTSAAPNSDLRLQCRKRTDDDVVRPLVGVIPRSREDHPNGHTLAHRRVLTAES